MCVGHCGHVVSTFRNVRPARHRDAPPRVTQNGVDVSTGVFFCHLSNQPVDASRKPTDTPKALVQWTALYETYQRLGFSVHLIDPIRAFPTWCMPQMVG